MAKPKPVGTTLLTGKAAVGRTVHLLVWPGPEGHIGKIENFSAELAARRELDHRDGWKYVGLKPGEVFSLGEGTKPVVGE